MRIIKNIAVLIICFSLTGCATIVTGIYQKVPVTSDPPGVMVRVDEKDSYTTPVKLRLRRYRDHLLTFTREGYLKEEVKLVHTISGAIAGNAVLFGLGGLLIDNWSGAQYKLTPTKVHVQMKKENG